MADDSRPGFYPAKALARIRESIPPTWHAWYIYPAMKPVVYLARENKAPYTDILRDTDPDRLIEKVSAHVAGQASEQP